MNKKNKLRHPNTTTIDIVYKLDYNDPDWKFFYDSDVWRAIRKKIFKICGYKCLKCYKGRDDGKILHIDHIIPRSVNITLQLDINNLQVLCKECNMDKLSSIKDYRTKSMKIRCSKVKYNHIDSVCKRYIK